jgi:hypothetical protein
VTSNPRPSPRLALALASPIASCSRSLLYLCCPPSHRLFLLSPLSPRSSYPSETHLRHPNPASPRPPSFLRARSGVPF